MRKLQEAAIKNENMFAVLMEATKYCSLGAVDCGDVRGGGAVQEEYVS
jgi:methylmalonyl-CoA mutase